MNTRSASGRKPAADKQKERDTQTHKEKKEKDKDKEKQREDDLKSRLKARKEEMTAQEQTELREREARAKWQVCVCVCLCSHIYTLTHIQEVIGPQIKRRIAGLSYVALCKEFNPKCRLPANPDKDTLRKTMRSTMAR